MWLRKQFRDVVFAVLIQGIRCDGQPRQLVGRFRLRPTRGVLRTLKRALLGRRVDLFHPFTPNQSDKAFFGLDSQL